MIPVECLEAYWEAYPDDECFYLEPSVDVIIGTADKSYEQPEGETKDIFMDRLKRSKEAGRNLFYEEWPEFKYIPGAVY